MSLRQAVSPLRLLGTLAWVGLVMSLRSSVVAAQAAQSCDTITTATLLKRLGEAVDGYRTGQQVWVAATFGATPQVLGVFKSAADARAVVDTAKICSHVFGPYVAPPDVSTGPSAERQVMMIAGVKHTPETIYYFTGRAVPADSVVSITVAMRLKDSTEIQEKYGTGDLDALFFTLPAVDKFVIPYYVRLYGLAYAASLRDQYLKRISR